MITRLELIDKIMVLMGLPKGKNTEDYFTKKQLMEMALKLEDDKKRKK